MSAGNPANDIILVRDEMHRTMMERGSKRLADAIGNYRRGWIPKASNDDVVWLVDTPVGTFVREAANEDCPAPLDRHPCVRCGVRRDHHHEGGCASYQRSRVA